MSNSSLRLFSGCIAVVMLLFACKKDEVPDTAKEGEGVPYINVVTYNVLQDDADRPAGYDWASRKEKIIQLLKTHETDILCAQEEYYQQGRYIMMNTGFAKVGVSRNTGTPTGSGEHVAIYYNKERFTVSDYGRFWMSETPDQPTKSWDASVLRICNWALFHDRNTGKDFYLFNTHTDHIGVVARVKSSEVILKHISEIAGDKPVILTGDMNSTPETTEIKTLAAELQDSRNITQTPPKGTEGTFNGADGRVVTRRIDYVFVNNLLDVLAYEVDDVADEKGNYPSDHFPVITRLQLKN